MTSCQRLLFGDVTGSKDTEYPSTFGRYKKSLILFCRAMTSYVQTMFENYSKCRIFQNSPKLTIFGIFNELLNVNVARFARNVECDFLGDFQTL